MDKEDMREAVTRLSDMACAIEDVLCDSQAPMSECMMALSTVFVSGILESGVTFETAVDLLRKVYDLHASFANTKTHTH